MGLPRFNEDSYAHFVTTKTYQGRRVFDDKECCRILIDSLWFYARRYVFDLIAYCVMPDHVHCIIQWDVEKYPTLTISRIVQSIKSHSAKEIVAHQISGRRKPSLSPYGTASESSRLPTGYEWTDYGNVHTPSTHRIWQPSFYDFNIYSEKKLRHKVEYIHWNPVRAGLCKRPEDWPWLA
ncbi:MAG: transposase [bacterium]|nr:transposase [bacterium]